MDPRHPFFNTQFNPPNNSQTPPQFESQSFSQPPQYDFQSFSQQYPFNPQYPPFNPQFFYGQTQFSSNQPAQLIDVQNPTTQKKKNAQGQQKERNPNWTKEEDEALCQAWLRVSEDAAIGTDQPRKKLWDRILHEYNHILGKSTDRISSSLMNRWSSIQSQLNKYSAYVRMVENAPKSGANVEDDIGSVKQLYYNEEGQHFKLDGCWLLLKDSPKWFHYTREQEAKKKKIKQMKRSGFTEDVDGIGDSSNPTTPSSATGSVNLDDDDDSPFNQGSHELTRPPGRKAAKNMRRKKNVDQLASLNLFVQEFSNLRNEQKEIAEREIAITQEREQLKIKAKQEQERLRLEAKLEQERMKIVAKQEQDRIKIAAKNEQERMRMEKEIMMVDPNSIPTEEGRAWVIAQQKTIWERMMKGGTRDGSSGSGF